MLPEEKRSFQTETQKSKLFYFVQFSKRRINESESKIAEGKRKKETILRGQKTIRKENEKKE